MQANVSGAQFPYQPYSFLPYIPWEGYTFAVPPPEYLYYYSLPDGLLCDGVTARCVVQW